MPGAVKAGVNDYVIKPFDNRNLLDRIANFLRIPGAGKPSVAPATMPQKEISPLDPMALSARIMELIGKGEVTMPSMPQIVISIEEKIKNDGIDLVELARLIEKDAGISSKANLAMEQHSVFIFLL